MVGLQPCYLNSKGYMGSICKDISFPFIPKLIHFLRHFDLESTEDTVFSNDESTILLMVAESPLS